MLKATTSRLISKSQFKLMTNMKLEIVSDKLFENNYWLLYLNLGLLHRWKFCLQFYFCFVRANVSSILSTTLRAKALLFQYLAIFYSTPFHSILFHSI